MISPTQIGKTLTTLIPGSRTFAPTQPKCPAEQPIQDRFTPTGDDTFEGTMSAHQQVLKQQQRLNELNNRRQLLMADSQHLNAEGKASGKLSPEDAARRMHEYNRLSNQNQILQRDLNSVLPNGGRMGGLDSPLFVDGKMTTQRQLEVERRTDLNGDGKIG